MYEVDDRDRVARLTDVPQSDVGSPEPRLLSDEHGLVLAYRRHEPPDFSDLALESEPGEPLALVRFSPCHAHMFGPPNDEAFDGHPLASRGLSSYGVFEVSHSSWIRRLERMNSVHPSHNPQRFWKRRHLIFTFHDSTFECVCDGFEVLLVHGLLESIVPKMATLLARKS